MRAILSALAAVAVLGSMFAAEPGSLAVQALLALSVAIAALVILRRIR